MNSSSGLPLYHQVAGILRQRIEDGTYAAGGRLLSEDDLASEFQVSRATIRQAIASLAMEGLVTRRQGSGTYVETRDKHVIRQRFRGSLGEFIQQSHRAATRDVTIAHDTPFPEYVAEALQVNPPKGTVIRRTRMMDGAPFAYTLTYLPADIGHSLTKAKLQRTALMGLLIMQGVALTTATQSIRAQLADLDVCARIDVPIGSAVLYVERVAQDDSGRPVEFVRSWYRGDRYEYTVTFDLDGDSAASLYVKLA